MLGISNLALLMTAMAIIRIILLQKSFLTLNDQLETEVLHLHGNALTGSIPASLCAHTTSEKEEVALLTPRSGQVAIATLIDFSADCDPEAEPRVWCDCCTYC